MKVGENYEMDLLKKQKTFTLEDVEVKTDIECNITFIDKQEELKQAKLWLELTSGDVGVDIETRGLDPLQHEVIMLQFGDTSRQFVVDTRVVDVTNIMGLLINDFTTLVGQNLKFEYKFFKHNWGLTLRKVKDTMLQEICLYNGYKLSNSLKALAKRYLNYEADKSIRMRFLEIGDKPFSKDEIIYGAYDVILPMKIDELQQKAIEERNQKTTLKIEHEYLKVLGDMELKGLLLDTPMWTKLYDENKIKYKAATAVLNKFIEDNNLSKYKPIQLDMFSTELAPTLMWSSSKQVIELFRDLNICPQEVSKTTKLLAYTVNADVLNTSLTGINKSIKKEYVQLIKDYIKMKEIEQRVTTFGITFIEKYVNPVTGRCHSNFQQIVSTGRSSSRSPNLQNIPSDKRYRACFVSANGNKIVNADFSGQENVVLANKSLDADLLEFYKGGKSDMHSFIASKIYEKPYEDYIIAKDVENPDIDQMILIKERQIAKAAGFAINYGGNGHTISKNLGITPKEGDRVYDAYFAAFPGLRNYFDKVIAETLKNGFIHVNDVSKRRLNLIDYKRMVNYERRPDKRTEYNKLKSKIGRLALNVPIQGTAADITKTAAIKFRNWVYSAKVDDSVWITNIIHDEINVECLEDKADLVANKLEELMAEAGDIWCKTVPLHAKAVISTHWVH